MIPKIIHYCWFGGKEKPELAKKCIASWRKFCPDWEIREWNENNFPISDHPYAAYCLAQGKWAFLSDFVRLAVVHEYGGIYMDTDVELIRSPEDLCKTEAFYGFEVDTRVATGLGFGAVAGHPTVQSMLEEYLTLEADTNGVFSFTACPALNTRALEKLGLIPNGQHQTVAGALILPADFLNPYEYTTGVMHITDNTYSIHWYNMSWISPWGKLRSKLTKPFHRIFGTDCFAWLKKEEKNP